MTGARETLPITDEALNAYVDGALHHTEAAHVARSAATDPNVAQRIAVLHQIKAAVAGIADDVVMLDARMPVAVASLWRPFHAALGAIAVAGMVALAVVWPAGFPDEPARGGADMSGIAGADAMLERFVTRHDAWINATEQSIATPSFDVWLEDLMARTGLRLVHHARAPLGEASEARHLAFVGPSGCRLSLFEAAAPDGPAPLRITMDGGLLTAWWADGGRGYALVARHMDRARFATIAATVHDASRDLGSVDAQAMARLQQARQPCLA